MALGVTVVIPTYGRDQVLVETIAHLLQCAKPPEEILVVDQTEQHTPEAEAALVLWQENGRIRWRRLSPPSIVRAMNIGLIEATQPIVLYLDDDIVPHADLVAEHRAGHAAGQVAAVVGQVLQPEDSPVDVPPRGARHGLRADMEFPFFSMRELSVSNVMAGNLSVQREVAIAAGGFDENFVGVAYRFETEFARRLMRHGGMIVFRPRASIRHLRASRGGTRSQGSHLTSASPRHGVGDYYFALRQGLSLETLWYICRRPFREVRTKFHLRHPWWIPVKLLGEVRAIALAIGLAWSGPKLLKGAVTQQTVLGEMVTT